MDYKDFEAGHSNQNFWFKSKLDLIKILINKLKLKTNNIKILNIGSGTGEELKVLCNYGKNYVIDIEIKALKLIDDKKCEHKNLSDACVIPYKDNSFDIVVCFDVMEHIEDDKKVVEEIYRVLKRKGNFIFSVPAYQFLFSSHDKALIHKRRYSKKQITKLLLKFNYKKIWYWNSILFFLIVILRIIKKKSKPEIDNINIPNCLDNLFYKIMCIDNYFFKHNVCLPFGLSIIGICKK